MPNFNPKYYSIFLLGLLFLEGCNKDAPPPVETKPIVNARIDRVYINEATISNKQIRYDLPIDSVIFHIYFTSNINLKELKREKVYFNNGIDSSYTLLKDTSQKVLSFRIEKQLNYFTTYTLYISSGRNMGINLENDYQYSFITQLTLPQNFPSFPMTAYLH